MVIEKIFAEISVNDLEPARAWYERLLGRPNDTAPMDGLVEWHFSGGRGIQVFHDEERAGASQLTVFVSSLDEQIAHLEALRIPVGPTVGTPGQSKVVSVSDPDGNRIHFAEDLMDNT
jgi:catechol 2,3-dioxygenase-like lactoylglutathione lyase family enzyme